MEKILKKIIKKRYQRIKKKGLHFGYDIPQKREQPLVKPNFEKGLVICEIKRGSPTEGLMKSIQDPVLWIKDYIYGGANVISVLTEEDFFMGSLKDLMEIKKKFPQMVVLRKDFLLTPQEVEISYRAGADMILLIVSVLVDLHKRDLTLLKTMLAKADELGLTALVEIHNEEEYEIIRSVNPQLIGINCRDLRTFKINRAYPLGLKMIFPQSVHLIYESGIRNYSDAFFAGSGGFCGILVGSSIMKSVNVPEKINEIKEGFIAGRNHPSTFFNKVFHEIYIHKRMPVKVCGITNIDDARFAVKEGAFIVGFVLAKSPRQIKVDAVKRIACELGSTVLKVVVVVDEYIDEAVNGVKEGWLDAVQFHGDITNEEAMSYQVSWYKAIRTAKKEDLETTYYSPFVLFDAFSKEAYGGTGKLIDKTILQYAKMRGIPFYLAGGLNPSNVYRIIKKYHPLLIDVSSGLEEQPGKKAPKKVTHFFHEVNKVNYCS